MEVLKIEFENIKENKAKLSFYEICKRAIDIIGAMKWITFVKSGYCNSSMRN